MKLSPFETLTREMSDLEKVLLCGNIIAFASSNSWNTVQNFRRQPKQNEMRSWTLVSLLHEMFWSDDFDV
jgi:hypothetical protein